MSCCCIISCHSSDWLASAKSVSWCAAGVVLPRTAPPLYCNPVGHGGLEYLGYGNIISFTHDRFNCICKGLQWRDKGVCLHVPRGLLSRYMGGGGSHLVCGASPHPTLCIYWLRGHRWNPWPRILTPEHTPMPSSLVNAPRHTHFLLGTEGLMGETWCEVSISGQCPWSVAVVLHSWTCTEKNGS